MFCLEGKKAVVTGGARGLGYGMAKGLLEAGAEVVILDLSDQVEQAAARLATEKRRCSSVVGDFRRAELVPSYFREAVNALGGELDILVNNAGRHDQTALTDLPLEQWNELLQVNVTAVFQMCQCAARVMLPRKKGKIINVGSIRSVLGALGACAYGTSKGAILQLTRSLSNDLAPQGIQVNAIAPGYMATAMTEHIKFDEEMMRETAKRIPAGRWGRPDDVAGLCVFLASPAADYITGAMIPCDGGYLAR